MPWPSGKYYIVIQHPGYTNNLDVYPDPSHQLVLSIYPVPGSALFRIGGAGALMSSQAANALIRALSSPFIDDTYMVMSFSLVNPQITINSSATHTLGERINLSGTTNLAPGNRLLVEVTSQTFGPTPKDQSGAFSGITDTVTVQDGPGDQNTWSFSFDTTSFIPDTYVVRVSGITVSNAVASTSFTLNPVTPTPTPTPPPTTRPTTPPTTEPTPVPTTTAGLTPITIIGAIAVFLVAFGIVRGRS